MTEINRIKLDDIDYDNVAAWLCGDELTEEQKADVLKLQITYDMATMHRRGIHDEFMMFEVKKENK